MSPAVSVLTTVYNGERYLPEAVESVRRQTFTDFEHVVVDDGSTDGTAAYLQSLTDSPVRVLRRPRMGRGAALNAGLSACRADLVAILDADDVAFPARLEVQHGLMADHPEIAVLGGVCSIRTANPPPHEEQEPNVTVVRPRDLIKRTPLAHSAAMFRRSCVEAVGGYDTSRDCLFDYDLWIRLVEGGFALARTDVPIVYKRIHRGQLFERPRRLRYLATTFTERRRAVRMFGERWVDPVYPFVGFAFGLIPVRIRMSLFRLSGER